MKIYDYNGRKNVSGNRIREARLKKRLSQVGRLRRKTSNSRNHYGTRQRQQNRNRNTLRR